MVRVTCGRYPHARPACPRRLPEHIDADCIGRQRPFTGRQHHADRRCDASHLLRRLARDGCHERLSCGCLYSHTRSASTAGLGLLPWERVSADVRWRLGRDDHRRRGDRHDALRPELHLRGRGEGKTAEAAAFQAGSTPPAPHQGQAGTRGRAYAGRDRASGLRGSVHWHCGQAARSSEHQRPDHPCQLDGPGLVSRHRELDRVRVRHEFGYGSDVLGWMRGCEMPFWDRARHPLPGDRRPSLGNVFSSTSAEHHAHGSFVRYGRE